VWDYSPQNVRYLAELGDDNVHYIPVGYSPRLERIKDAAAQDIDILFFGAISERRRLILDQLHKAGFRTAALFGQYGEGRDAQIARGKIQLNVHQFATSHLEQLRLAYLLNNRRFVVSETASDNPYGDGVVFCHYDEIVARCAEYLRPGMDAERARVAQLGHD